eukprot:TRINITY_DN1602_c2_g2_i1.p1 TRINITY_DN1602_c2_g2~~TRINITY_DN1602_c2_g2_i1.p1  ORF type:complete len:322 (-),score=128.87 TRINITY_DN1602_c2_g2_i1:55-1020(-)
MDEVTLKQELDKVEHQRVEAKRKLRDLERGSGSGGQRDKDNQGGNKRGRGEQTHYVAGGRGRGRVGHNNAQQQQGGDRSRPFSDRGPPAKRRAIKEEDDNTQTVSSVVMKTEREDRKGAVIEQDANIKSRNRRLFGSLVMGTLQQAKKAEEVKTTTDVKRAEIETKIQSKLEEEKAAVTDAHKKELAELKEKEQAAVEELNKKSEELQKQILENVWSKHKDELSKFRKTITTPHIYYTLSPNAPPFEFPEPKVKEESTTTTTTTTSTDNRRRRHRSSSRSSSSSSSSDSESEKQQDNTDSMDTNQSEPTTMKEEQADMDVQ